MDETDIERLMALKEHEVFFLLLTLTQVNARMEIEYFEHPRATDEMAKELTLIRQSISLVISLLEKFGVNDLRVKQGGAVTFSPSGVKWFNFWKRWFDQLEARGNLDTFLKLLKAGADISSWLPEKTYAQSNEDTSGAILGEQG